MEGADVGMAQSGDGAGLALETIPALGIFGEVFGEDLDGDDSIQSRITGFVDFTHPARAQWREDFVGA